MLRDDPNASSAVYLLTSDDKYAICGTNFLPNQLLCRNMKMDENRGKELNNKINEFFTNLPPKTLTSMQYNDLLPA